MSTVPKQEIMMNQASKCSRRVSFPPIPVTSVTYRPRTHHHDCRRLFYSKADIQEFRSEYNRVEIMNRLKIDNRRVIRFADSVVTSVRTVPSCKSMTCEEIKAMYYTSEELECFLSDYVTSIAMGTDNISDDSNDDIWESSCESLPTPSTSNETQRADVSCIRKQKQPTRTTTERSSCCSDQRSSRSMTSLQQRRDNVGIQQPQPVFRQSCHKETIEMKSRSLTNLSEKSRHLAKAA